MKRRSRRYKKAKEFVGEKKRTEIADALTLLKSLPGPKFDETIEIAMKLGIDPRKSDQMVRGSYSLPHGIGKELSVICFAVGEKAEEARKAGAKEVGGEELAKKIQDGWLDFDVAIATPDMMRVVGKLGRILGPKGKMPSPKAGTVTQNVDLAIREYKLGKIEYRTDSAGNIHAPMGKKSFALEKLTENIEAFIEHIRSRRPPAAKGNFLQNVTVSSTMGPGIPIALK